MYKRGWLHRDISYGNVLLLETPLACQEFNECVLCSAMAQMIAYIVISFTEIFVGGLEECFGFLTDGDLAIRWKVKRTDVGKRRSVRG